MRSSIRIYSVPVLILLVFFAVYNLFAVNSCFINTGLAAGSGKNNVRNLRLKAKPTPVIAADRIDDKGWLSTWGGEDFISGCGNCGNWYDTCSDVAVDDAGNVYVTGRSMESSYADSTGIAFLTKFDPSSNMIWRHQWAGGAGMGIKLA
ncbi:MAG: SBBP repeat-containing protein, partial [bacterium]